MNSLKYDLGIKPVGISLFLVSSLGLLLRIINLSKFNIYPDSYVFLLMTKNIVELSPVGSLGPNGMFNELQFGWITRLAYPLLIIPLNAISHNLEFSARTVSIVLAVLSIPLIFLLVTKLFDSRRMGIVASFLLAISFTHVAWSGFVMAETTAIFFILLSLVFTVYGIKRASFDFGNFYDVLAGIFAALAIITRPEYFFLVLPILFLLTVDSKHYWGRVLTFLSSLFSLLTIISVATYFMREQLSALPKVIPSYSALIIASTVLLLLITVLTRKKIGGRQKTLSVLKTIAAFFTLSLFVYVYLQLIFGEKIFPYWSKTLTATRIFAQYDFLIVILGALGIVYLLFDKKYSHIGFFALLYIMPLAVLYNQVNPLSYRYSVHHLPVLIIAGSFLIINLADLIKRKLQNASPKISSPIVSFVILLAVFVSLFQIKISADSMTGWIPEISYEKKAAMKVAKIMEDKNIPKDTVLITFFVEPYYIYTNKSTGSVYLEYPYIPLKDFPSSKPILIVVDEALRDQRPSFAKFVKRNLSSFEVDRFWVGTPYALETYQKEEKEPVILYYLSGKKFTSMLSYKNRKN